MITIGQNTRMHLDSLYGETARKCWWFSEEKLTDGHRIWKPIMPPIDSHLVKAVLIVMREALKERPFLYRRKKSVQ